MATQDESFAPHDVGGAGFDDGVLVGLTGGGLGAQRQELVRRPERRQIKAIGMHLLEHVDVPFEVQFADTVVRDRQCLGVGVCGEIEVVALDGDQMAPVRVDDAEREVESFRLLDRLIAGDDAAVPIDQHGAACAMVAQGLCERRAPTIGTAVGIVGVRLEIRQPERVTDGSCRSGHMRRLSAAIAASTTDVRCRATTRYPTTIRQTRNWNKIY